MYDIHIRPTGPNGNRGKLILLLASSVPSSAPLRKRLNIREWDCLAVHEKAALWVMGASHSEGHQGTTYHPALRHEKTISNDCFFLFFLCCAGQLLRRIIAHWRSGQEELVKR